MTVAAVWSPGIVVAGVDLSPAIVTAIQNALSPAQTVALTAWAEARSRLEPGRGWVSNPIEAMADIVNILDNRAKDRRWKAGGHKGACLAFRQFSCWAPLDGVANFHEVMTRAQRLLAGETPSDKLLNCLALAEGAIGGSMTDTLLGATHYYAPASMVPKGRVPTWAVPPARFVLERFGHRFYAAVR